MEEKKQIVYILSALELTSENIVLACEKRFQRITTDYILVYDEEIPEGAVEISAKDINALSPQDAEWLAKCNMSLIKEFIEEHKDAQKNSLHYFKEELDKYIREELDTDKSDKENVDGSK